MSSLSHAFINCISSSREYASGLPPHLLPYHHRHQYIFVVLAQGLNKTRTPMSSKRIHGIPESDEDTPLLHEVNPLGEETPLPIAQILVLLLLQLAEPITSFSIKPYINQVRSSIPVM